MIKPKVWLGDSLKGDWVFTVKLDGVRALKGEDGYISRSRKPLYNLPQGGPEDCEVFIQDWNTTVSRVRTMYGSPIGVTDLYSIDPVDSRLLIGEYTDPTAAFIQEQLDKALSHGYEGLVLRQGNKWLKVKPVETHDEPIIGVIEGKGKNVGKLGSFVTAKGNVGTGLTDDERRSFWAERDNLINEGVNIEIESMGLTKNNKFRHPRFKRLRWDKT